MHEQLAGLGHVTVPCADTVHHCYTRELLTASRWCYNTSMSCQADRPSWARARVCSGRASERRIQSIKSGTTSYCHQWRRIMQTCRLATLLLVLLLCLRRRHGGRSVSQLGYPKRLVSLRGTYTSSRGGTWKPVSIVSTSLLKFRDELEWTTRAVHQYETTDSRRRRTPKRYWDAHDEQRHSATKQKR